MAITPNTNLRLLKCPIEVDNRNQIDFTSATAQYNYFNSLPKLTVDDDDFSYQRKDSVIAYPDHIDNIIEYNYCMYQNENYSNKWFYAFITDMKYENDGLTYITIKTDVYQSWLFDLTFKASFIEREHVDDDTIGLHTVPENLNTGDMISDFSVTPNSLVGAESYFWLVVASNWQPAFGGVTSGSYSQTWVYGGYPQATAWFAWLINWNNPSDLSNFNDWVEAVTNEKHADDIQAVFALPFDAFNIIGDVDENTHKVGNGKGIKFNQDYNLDMPTMHSFIQGNTTLSVKNNKLYCYPYNFLRVTNNAGNYNDYRIEDFEADSLGNYGFNCIGVPCIGYSCKLRPKQYKGLSFNEDESIALGKYPTLSWATDAFINWLTQNSINIGSNIIQSLFGASKSVISGDTGTGIFSMASTTANIIGQIDKAAALPNTAEGNVNQGDVSFAFNLLRFKIQKIRPKKEYIEILDNYFSMFGYKVNEVKVPNLRSRTNWNYIKTIDINIEADIPQADLEEIKQMFNNGLTLWHNTSYYLDYTQNNTIVS